MLKADLEKENNRQAKIIKAQQDTIREQRKAIKDFQFADTMKNRMLETLTEQIETLGEIIKYQAEND